MIYNFKKAEEYLQAFPAQELAERVKETAMNLATAALENDIQIRMEIILKAISAMHDAAGLLDAIEEG